MTENKDNKNQTEDESLEETSEDHVSDEPTSEKADEVVEPVKKIVKASTTKKKDSVKVEQPSLRVDDRQWEDDEDVQRLPSRLSRFASGAFAAVTGARTSPGAGKSMSSRLAILRKFMLPIVTFGFFVIVLILFKEILLPFILALVIVYLMEPIVGRVGRKLPRWVAVILVYLTFFGVITTTVILMTPRLVSEIVRFTETVPEEIQAFRRGTLPELNKKMQGYVETYAPPFVTGGKKKVAQFALRNAVNEARGHVQKGTVSSGQWVTATSEASRLIHLSTQQKFTERWEGGPFSQQRVWSTSYSDVTNKKLALKSEAPIQGVWALDALYRPEPALRIVPDKHGGMKVYLDDLDVDLTQIDAKTWQVRRSPTKSSTTSANEPIDLSKMLDLERGLDKLINNIARSSSAKLTSLLTFAQQIVVGVIQVFVGLILTLMVAAFISIDLNSVMGFFRAMIPEDHRDQYDTLLKDLDRGLSGVVRGQLTICLVNGVLTYIGCAFLNIKFSLLLGIVAGCLSLIPIFGTIMSTIPIVLFGWTTSFMTGIFALLWIMFIHFLEANILNPKIIGTSAHIHPVIVIFALLAGESAFGLLGALLAVPTASICLTLFRFFLIKTTDFEEGDAYSEETKDAKPAPKQ